MSDGIIQRSVAPRKAMTGASLKRKRSNEISDDMPDDMPDDRSFALFGKLPPEIRVRIWRHSVPTWSVCSPPRIKERKGSSRQAIYQIHHASGGEARLACKEACHELRPTLATTIISLHTEVAALRTLMSSDPQTTSFFKHVAIQHTLPLVGVFQGLAQRCPRLETIILYTVGWSPLNDGGGTQGTALEPVAPLVPQVAARCIAAATGSWWIQPAKVRVVDEKLRDAIRSAAAEIFASPPPTLHFIRITSKELRLPPLSGPSHLG